MKDAVMQLTKDSKEFTLDLQNPTLPAVCETIAFHRWLSMFQFSFSSHTT